MAARLLDGRKLRKKYLVRHASRYDLREEGTMFERGSRHRFKDYLSTSYRMLRRKLRDNKLHAFVLVFLRIFMKRVTLNLCVIIRTSIHCIE